LPPTLRDSTRHHPARTLIPALAIAIVVLWSAAVVQTARADGDPASDVLLSQQLFLPQDAGVPAVQQAQLTSLLAAARRAGYSLRVAVIADPSDLGSVTALWHQPTTYARFLGQELSLNDDGPLLVVMPDGYGFYRSRGPTGEQSTLAALPAPGRALGPGALRAIERLAAAAGHPVSTPTASARAHRRPADAFAWIVFLAGTVVIVLSWTASLRARPFRARAA
jgi:hypothetical protein